MTEKIATASEKKDFIVSATKQRASIKNEHAARKATEIQNIRNEEIKILDSLLTEKMIEGMRRNQEFLSKRSEKSVPKSSSEDSGSLGSTEVGKVSSACLVTDAPSSERTVAVAKKVGILEFIQNIGVMVWTGITSLFGRFNVKL